MTFFRRWIGRALLCLGVPLAAQGQAPVCADPGSTMLWQVDAGDRKVHLFGSIHVGKPEFYPLPERIDAAFREAETLVFEVDPAAMADPALLLEIQARGMLPAGQTLADVLTPATLEELRRVLDGAGLPLESFMRLQPWLLTLSLTSLQMMREGYSPQYGLESWFMARKPADVDVLELESVREQIGYLEELNAESFLAYTLESFEASSEELERMMAAWQCADHENLGALLFEAFAVEDDPALAALKTTLIDARNERMAEGVLEFVQRGEGDYFVVVGAAHLLGEGSVVDLLRRAGLEVESVRLD